MTFAARSMRGNFTDQRGSLRPTSDMLQAMLSAMDGTQELRLTFLPNGMASPAGTFPTGDGAVRFQFEDTSVTQTPWIAEAPRANSGIGWSLRWQTNAGFPPPEVGAAQGVWLPMTETGISWGVLRGDTYWRQTEGTIQFSLDGGATVAASWIAQITIG